MAQFLQGQAGQQVTSDGAAGPLRLGRWGDLVVSELKGRYYEEMFRGNVFSACNSASTAVTSLNATATGFILSNPAGSGKNLWLIDITLIQTSTATTTANAGISLAANTNPVAAATTHTTPLIVRPTLLGSGNTAVGLADSSATLPAAPVRVRPIWQPSVSATATVSIPPTIKDEIAGLFGVSPGCTVSLTAESAFSVIAAMTWGEAPIT